jgi:flagellar P-ring protein FlgI
LVLQGTGDGLRNSPFTRQTLEATLERLGVNTRDQQLQSKNVAAVIVTANLPPFATQGSRIDITVSALGDSTSLEGGTLLMTELKGANLEVYAVGQGQLTVGGFAAGGASGSGISRGVPTNGRIPNGATIQRELRFDIGSQTELASGLAQSRISPPHAALPRRSTAISMLQPPMPRTRPRSCCRARWAIQATWSN